MDRLQSLCPICAVQHCCHRDLLKKPFTWKKFASYISAITDRLCCLNWAFFNRLSEYKPLWSSNPFSASPAWIPLSSAEANDYNPVRHANRPSSHNTNISHTIQPIGQRRCNYCMRAQQSYFNNLFSFNEATC